MYPLKYTVSAYETRTGKKCLPLSFADIADGKLGETFLPNDKDGEPSNSETGYDTDQRIDMVKGTATSLSRDGLVNHGQEIVLDRVRCRLYRSVEMGRD
jgi:hypothetical protein